MGIAHIINKYLPYTKTTEGRAEKKIYTGIRNTFIYMYSQILHTYFSKQEADVVITKTHNNCCQSNRKRH